jgi:hypothetical protein
LHARHESLLHTRSKSIRTDFRHAHSISAVDAELSSRAHVIGMLLLLAAASDASHDATSHNVDVALANDEYASLELELAPSAGRDFFWRVKVFQIFERKGAKVLVCVELLNAISL